MLPGREELWLTGCILFFFCWNVLWQWLVVIINYTRKHLPDEFHITVIDCGTCRVQNGHHFCWDIFLFFGGDLQCCSEQVVWPALNQNLCHHHHSMQRRVLLQVPLQQHEQTDGALNNQILLSGLLLRDDKAQQFFTVNWL